MQDIIEIIKHDKLKEFEMKISDANSNLSFGRFPLLSICYLYDSKKIIKKYESKLLKVKDYEIVNEPKELYSEFKKVAGRCLRLYVNNEIVSPLEMLLILGNASKVESLYFSIANNNAIKNRLINIQKIKTSEEIVINDKAIVVPKQPLSKKKKGFIKCMIAVVSVMILISVFAIGWFGFTGVNTSSSTIKVFTSKQLLKSLEKNIKGIELMSDIELNDVNISNLNTSIDGNGHTIMINKTDATPVFNNINSELKNVNIIYNVNSMSVNSNIGLITNVNYGLIDNVSININVEFTVSKTEDQDLYIAAFAYKNEGKILNSVMTGNVSVQGNIEVNSSFSGIVGINSGIINGCITQDDSKIMSDDVDLAGVCTLNKEKGEIINCINNANISQKGTSEKWNPNIGGIVVENCGKVSGCVNNAELKLISEADVPGTNGIYAYTYLGGIVATNVYGTIEDCKSNGNLISETKVNNVNVGGIASINYLASSTAYGKINNCKVECDILIKSTKDMANIMVGGICGYNYSIISNSYAINSWDITYNDKNDVCIGGIVGAITQALHTNYLWGNIYMYDNKYYITDEVSFSTGHNSLDKDFAGVGVSAKEEIKGAEDNEN